MTKTQIKTLMDKLRQPMHINYISKYILKEDIDITKKELDILISVGFIKVSEMSEGYYVTK